MVEPLFPPIVPSIFGRVVSGHDVERWVVDLLRKWIGTSLAEVERQNGLIAGELARPRAYVLATRLDHFPEDQLPVVTVVCPGIAERPSKDGESRYRVRWDVRVGAIVSARDQAQTHLMAQLYVAALAMTIAQHPSLEGHAAGIDWVGASVNELDWDGTRSLEAGEAAFTVEIEDVLTQNAGPATPSDPLDPDTDPWADWPTVLTVETTVENEPVDQPLPQEGTP